MTQNIDTRELTIAILADAIENEELRANDASFAFSLVQQYESRGRLSDKQWYWVEKLVSRADQPAAPAADLSSLIEMFDNTGLKYPKVRTESEHGELKLSRAGESSRYPGALQVKAAGAWVGRVERNGSLTRGRGCPEWVEPALVAMAADPAAVMAKHGHDTGSCCMCSRELSDERSLHVGYGPVCADRYGLPWGDRPAAEEAPDDDDGMYPTTEYGCRHTPENSWWEYDARGIELAKVCDHCVKQQLAKFRSDVLTDSEYWADEPVDA